MKTLFVLLIAVGASVFSDPALARKSDLRADRIQFSYVPPKNPEHETVFRLLKERQVLEKFKQFLSPRPVRFYPARGVRYESNSSRFATSSGRRRKSAGLLCTRTGTGAW